MKTTSVISPACGGARGDAQGRSVPFQEAQGVFPLLGVPSAAGAGAASEPQGPDGGLAAVAEECDPFIEDLGLVFLAGAGVTRAPWGQHFRSRDFAHGGHGSAPPMLCQRRLPQQLPRLW